MLKRGLFVAPISADQCQFQCLYLYEPPANGALVCLNRDDDGSASFCQVACKSGTDFNFNPPMLYVCPYDGHWKTEVGWPLSRVPPWPNCSSTISCLIIRVCLLSNGKAETEKDAKRLGVTGPKFYFGRKRKSESAF